MAKVLEFLDPAGRFRSTKRYGKQVVKAIQALGPISAPELVEKARPRTSPLHHLFDWDNTRAAERWRLHQAHVLLLSIKVTFTEKPKTGPPVHVTTRAYFPVGQKRAGQYRQYLPTKQHLQNPDLRAALLATALSEAKQWADRYAMLKELAGIIAAIRAVDARTRPKRKGA